MGRSSRTSYNSFVHFEGKIKSMRLISELIGYGPMPVPDQEVEQRLTLNSRGQLWFSNYLYGDGVKYKLHHKERRTISSTDAENILQAVSKMFASPQTYALIADVGMWRMTLLNEVGQYFEYEGALASYGENDPLGVISDELRKTLSMPQLAAFDGDFHILVQASKIGEAMTVI